MIKQYKISGNSLTRTSKSTRSLDLQHSLSEYKNVTCIQSSKSSYTLLKYQSCTHNFIFFSKNLGLDYTVYERVFTMYVPKTNLCRKTLQRMMYHQKTLEGKIKIQSNFVFISLWMQLRFSAKSWCDNVNQHYLQCFFHYIIFNV